VERNGHLKEGKKITRNTGMRRVDAWSTISIILDLSWGSFIYDCTALLEVQLYKYLI
jgi:uncharacterized membrane protein